MKKQKIKIIVVNYCDYFLPFSDKEDNSLLTISFPKNLVLRKLWRERPPSPPHPSPLTIRICLKAIVYKTLHISTEEMKHRITEDINFFQLYLRHTVKNEFCRGSIATRRWKADKSRNILVKLCQIKKRRNSPVHEIRVKTNQS